MFAELLVTVSVPAVAVLKAKHGLNVVGEAAGKAGSSRPIRTVEMRAGQAVATDLRGLRAARRGGGRTGRRLEEDETGGR